MEQREKYMRTTSAKMAQKTAQAAASNAAKLEKAKGLAIDRLVAALEHFPSNAGDTLRQYGKDKNGNRFTNQYSLIDIVSALEKLERNSTIESADDPLLELFRRMDEDVKSDVQP